MYLVCPSAFDNRGLCADVVVKLHPLSHMTTPTTIDHKTRQLHNHPNIPKHKKKPLPGDSGGGSWLDERSFGLVDVVSNVLLH